MTTKIHRNISTTPSTAIHQALDDLEAIRRTPGYEIAMDTWWTSREGMCTVCFGGCLMAGVLDYHPNLTTRFHDLSPGTLVNLGLISVEQQHVIEAMDDIREDEAEDIVNGLKKMGVPNDIAEGVIGVEYISYDEDPESFISQRRELADALKAQGY